SLPGWGRRRAAWPDVSGTDVRLPSLGQGAERRRPLEATNMKGRSRKRVLSREELELWTSVTRYDAPLARPGAIAPALQETAAETLPASPAQMPAAAAPAPSKLPPSSANRKTVSAPPPQPFDPRAAKRIARGRREIDARLDLHGMRQQDAYAAL